MRIQRARIKNFRCLRDVEIEFDDVTSFIGPNGVGKSTVLRALDWFFNGGRANVLTDDDLTMGFDDAPIEVEVTFRSLTDEDRAMLGKYAPAGASTFTAWKRRDTDGREYLSANCKAFPAFAEVRNTVGSAARRAIYARLRSDRPELNLPPAANAQAVDDAITAWESAHTAELHDAPQELETNFFGFNGDSVMGGLFDFVLISADLRAVEEAQDSKSSILGRILERTVDRSAAEHRMSEIVDAAQRQQQEAFDEAFGDDLAKLTAELNNAVAAFSPGRSVMVRPTPIELRVPRTTFSVVITDGDAETAIERQGHGFQRTVLIAALQMLASQGSDVSAGTICLALEEPELYQHPTQAMAFAQVLRALAESPGQHTQVMYATHSPYFVEPRNFHQVRRLVRADPAARVIVHSSDAAQVAARAAGIIDPEKVATQLDGVVGQRLTEAIFAHRALIVEGTTEVAVLYGIADREASGLLEREGVSVVPAGGKTNIPLVHAVLATLGIPTYAMFDSDIGFESRAGNKGKGPSQITTDRANHAKTNRRLLEYFAMPRVDFPEPIVGERAAIIDNDLESLLHSTWPEWTTACEVIAIAGGISLQKNQNAYRLAARAADGFASDFLLEVLQRARGFTPTA